MKLEETKWKRGRKFKLSTEESVRLVDEVHQRNNKIPQANINKKKTTAERD